MLQVFPRLGKRSGSAGGSIEGGIGFGFSKQTVAHW